MAAIERAKNYPQPFVEISCKHCGRNGRISRAKFVEIVGADTPLTEALRAFVKHEGCKEVQPTPDDLDGSCNPHYRNNL
jgi:hypothetical protein